MPHLSSFSCAGSVSGTAKQREVLHHNEIHCIGTEDVAVVDNVGINTRRRGLGFLHEAPLVLRVGHFFG